MWEFSEIVEIYKDPAEKFNVRVELVSATESISLFLKFDEEPSEDDILLVSQDRCNILNNPEPPGVKERL